MVSGDVYQIIGKEFIITDGEGNELTLPKSEMIQKDRFKKGESVKAVIHKVDMNNGTPKIILLVLLLFLRTFIRTRNS